MTTRLLRWYAVHTAVVFTRLSVGMTPAPDVGQLLSAPVPVAFDAEADSVAPDSRVPL